MQRNQHPYTKKMFISIINPSFSIINKLLPVCDLDPFKRSVGSCGTGRLRLTGSVCADDKQVVVFFKSRSYSSLSWKRFQILGCVTCGSRVGLQHSVGQSIIRAQSLFHD